MPKKRPTPRFASGQTVMVSILKRYAVIKGDPRWNGLTWMYHFENEDARCGEDYLLHSKEEDAGFASIVAQTPNIASNIECVIGAFKDLRIVDSGEAVTVLSRNYNEPMQGNCCGCEMAVIRYIPDRKDSKERALQMAWAIVNCCIDNPVSPI